MERIQAALSKARATRESRMTTPAAVAAPATAPQAYRPPQDAGPAPAATLWSEMPRAEIRPRRLRARRVVAFEGGPQASEFDQLRTRMLQRMQAEGWRRVAVVSPTPQNGKSTVSANLAFSCARQAYMSTMLIELDLRRPSLSPMLDLPARLDVSQVLSGEGRFSDHAVRLRDNMIVAPTRPVRDGASELLQNPEACARLDAVSRDYAPSVTLFDMPPMGAADDVIGFLSNVDCAVIVAAAGSTSIAEIDACERDVAERTAVLGVVLNKCRFERRKRSYDYY